MWGVGCLKGKDATSAMGERVIRIPRLSAGASNGLGEPPAL